MMTTIDDFRVKDVMSDVVITIGSEDTIHTALVLMAQYSVTVLPVTDNKDRCIGVLSTSDLIDPARQVEDDLQDADRDAAQERITALLAQSLGHREVRDLMTAAVVTVDREMPIMEAAAEMLRDRIHHLPVVDAQHKIRGIVSTMDLLSVFHRCFADHGM